MIQIADHIFRGPAPSLDELQSSAIKATLDLESGKQVIGDDLPLSEAMMCDSIGVRCYPCPLGGILPPSVSELRLAVSFLRRQTERKERTLVHCKHGVDRTGIVIAAYRILIGGVKPIDAAKECLGMGMHRIYLPWLVQLWRL